MFAFKHVRSLHRRVMSWLNPVFTTSLGLVSSSPKELGHDFRPCLNIIFVTMLAISLAGGGSLQANTRRASQYNLVTVTLTPTSANVTTGGTLTFTASASHASANENISWSVDG